MEMENMSPVQLAKHLIEDDVISGFSVDHIKSGWECMCSRDYHVQVGGWVNDKKYGNDKIIVSRSRGQEVLIVFPIQKIVNLIKSKQQSLF